MDCNSTLNIRVQLPYILKRLKELNHKVRTTSVLSPVPVRRIDKLNEHKQKGRNRYANFVSLERDDTMKYKSLSFSNTNCK